MILRRVFCVVVLAAIAHSARAIEAVDTRLCERVAAQFDGKTLIVLADPADAVLGDDVTVFDDDTPPVEDDATVALVSVSGRRYALVRGDERLAWLARVAPGAKPVVLCEFEWDGASRRHRALDGYQRFVRIARRKGVDPFMLAIDRRDADAVRQLVARGRTIDSKLDVFSSPLVYAVWQLDDRQPADLAFVRLLVDLGADPDAGGPSESGLFVAVWHGKPMMAELLFSRARSVRSVTTFDIVRFGSSFPATGRLLREHARIAQETDEHAIEFALGNGDVGLLRYFADARTPVVERARFWINGRESGLPPGLYRRLARLPDAELGRRIAFLPTRMRPAEGERGPGDWMEFEKGRRRLIVNTYSPNPREGHVVELGVSLCVHLWGGDCGPPGLRERAQRWMDALPSNCPVEAARIYDADVCKLAVESARVPHMYSLATCELASDRCEAIDSVNVLGRRSIAARR